MLESFSRKVAGFQDFLIQKFLRVPFSQSNSGGYFCTISKSSHSQMFFKIGVLENKLEFLFNKVALNYKKRL